MRAVTFDQTGRQVGEAELPKDFSGKVNLPLLAQAVRVSLSNLHPGRAKTKTRAEVARTTAKWFRQKGTGRARHGARSAPIFVGGGVAHGPLGEKRCHLVIPRKMRRVALVSALSAKARDGEVKVLVGMEKGLGGKTKEMAKLLGAIAGEGRQVTLVLPQMEEKVARAVRNLSWVRVFLAGNLNAYEVLRGGVLVIVKEALATWGGAEEKQVGVERVRRGGKAERVVTEGKGAKKRGEGGK